MKIYQLDASLTSRFCPLVILTFNYNHG